MSERELFRVGADGMGAGGLPYGDEDDLWSSLDMTCEAATEHGHIARLHGLDPDGDAFDGDIMLFDGSGTTLPGLFADRGLALWEAREDRRGDLCVELRSPEAPTDRALGLIRAVVRPVGEALFLHLTSEGVEPGVTRCRDRNGPLRRAWEGCGPMFLGDTWLDDGYRACRTGLVERVTDCRSEDELLRWFHQRDQVLLAHSTDFPACWGGQMRVSEQGGYVSTEAWESILPSYDERQVWLAIADGALEDVSASELLWHIHRWRTDDTPRGEVVDLGFFEELVDGLLYEVNCPCYYTEVSPEELDDDELRECVETRPDLAEDAAAELDSREGASQRNESLASQGDAVRRPVEASPAHDRGDARGRGAR